MTLIRRFWAAGLILIMVAIHAAVIGYMRSRVAHLNSLRSSAIEIGQFRFQPIRESDRVYHFRLHAVVDPAKRQQGEVRLTKMRMEILESAEQMLRQVDPLWLKDPAQIQIRERLMEIVLEHFDAPLIQRVVITDWLEMPVSSLKLGVHESLQAS